MLSCPPEVVSEDRLHGRPVRLLCRGPHPGSYEKSIGATRTDELAVMVDTYRPLAATAAARSVEDPDGFWHEEARRIEWIEQNMLDGPPVFEACQPSALGK